MARLPRDNTRSFTTITRADLERLAVIAEYDRRDLFRRKPLLQLYRRRLICVALCQGAALHYVYGQTGVKDLDVWSFYVEHPTQPFPYRRRKEALFGDGRYGPNPNPQFRSKTVDLIGRSISCTDPSDDPVAVLRRYLAAAQTPSSRELARQAAVIVAPAHLLATVAWPY